MCVEVPQYEAFWVGLDGAEESEELVWGEAWVGVYSGYPTSPSQDLNVVVVDGEFYFGAESLVGIGEDLAAYEVVIEKVEVGVLGRAGLGVLEVKDVGFC